MRRKMWMSAAVRGILLGLVVALLVTAIGIAIPTLTKPAFADGTGCRWELLYDYWECRDGWLVHVYRYANFCWTKSKGWHCGHGYMETVVQISVRCGSYGPQSTFD